MLNRHVKTKIVVTRANGGRVSETIGHQMEELKLLKEEVQAIIRNRLVLPHTLLQMAKERVLSPEECDRAMECLQGCITLVEYKFSEALRRQYLKAQKREA